MRRCAAADLALVLLLLLLLLLLLAFRSAAPLYQLWPNVKHVG